LAVKRYNLVDDWSDYFNDNEVIAQIFLNS